MSETTSEQTEKPAAELIRPCPFCGNAPVVRRSVEEYAANAEGADGEAGEYECWVNVCCHTCGIEIGAEYRSEALELWNARKAPERPFTGYQDVPDPLPMEAEIWAAGADPETAHFVARMLGNQGYELVKVDAPESEDGE